ncbi:hypothetical protein V2J09_014223 [Rumex salicifolius]
MNTALEKTADAKKMVIITVVNKAYVEAATKGGNPMNMLDLFLESFWFGEETRPLINNFLIVATDPTAYKRCVFRGLHCYLLGNEMDGSDLAGEKVYVSQDFINMVWRRTLFLLTVLRRGYDFIFTDTDVMWLRNPFTILNDDTNNIDIQFSTDEFNGNPRSESNVINTGFYMVRSNPKTISLFERWYDAKDASVDKKEQDVMQSLIRQGVLNELNITASFLNTLAFNGLCQYNMDPQTSRNRARELLPLH